MKKILGGLLLAFVFAVPQAYAGLVPTERERVKALIERPEVAQQMEKMGIPAKEALARVDAMTDEEVRSLAGRLDALPAGGPISRQTPLLICLLLILLLLFLATNSTRSPRSFPLCRRTTRPPAPRPVPATLFPPGASPPPP